MSVDDTQEQNHSLFEEYRDPCRAGPGKEKPWVIGLYHFNLLHFSKCCIFIVQYIKNFDNSWGIAMVYLKVLCWSSPRCMKIM